MSDDLTMHPGYKTKISDTDTLCAKLLTIMKKICEAETAADRCQEGGGECYDGLTWCGEHAWMLNKALKEVRVVLANGKVSK